MHNHVDLMVISPHADDSEFGAAGTVASWTRNGKTAVYVICTDGDKGTTDRNMDPILFIEKRKKEQEKAAALLGVCAVVFLGYPDQGLEDNDDFRKKIVSVIRKFRPHTIMTTDPYRKYLWHRDHRITGQVVMDACYPYARDHLSYPDLLEQGLEPHKVRDLLFWGAEDINYRVDISETFEQKIAALYCHESQMKEMKHFNPEEWCRQNARKMAAKEPFELAEGFHRIVLPG
ncbi:MAG: PIG-L family deacetylase [Desulfobulbaceae bacterium]|uniref:PIG-L family deacetylase n=1 Tax=Candidatus Desulfobia pelagia TaxID=2841692 RepID=A0A8J6TFU1_9BACT|nr:PIG-L family deacetylase [Candidatus Desulfobia pelagia]